MRNESGFQLETTLWARNKLGWVDGKEVKSEILLVKKNPSNQADVGIGELTWS